MKDMKKLCLGPTLAAVIGAALLYGEPAAAQVQTVSVTGGQVKGVLADGITSDLPLACAGKVEHTFGGDQAPAVHVSAERDVGSRRRSDRKVFLVIADWSGRGA